MTTYVRCCSCGMNAVKSAEGVTCPTCDWTGSHLSYIAENQRQDALFDAWTTEQANLLPPMTDEEEDRCVAAAERMAGAA